MHLFVDELFFVDSNSENNVPMTAANFLVELDSI